MRKRKRCQPNSIFARVSVDRLFQKKFQTFCLRHLRALGGPGRRRDRTALLGQGTPGVGPSSPSATLTLTRAGAGLETFPIFPHFSIFCQSLNESWGPARFTVDLRRIYVAEPSRRLFPKKKLNFFLGVIWGPRGGVVGVGIALPF